MHELNRNATPVRATIILAALLSCLAGCAGRKDKAPPPVLTAEDMYAKAMSQISRHNLTQAVETLERIDLGYGAEDREQLEPLVKLSMADATYYQGTDLGWISAQSLYNDFVMLYADHGLAPYAQFQIGMCSLKQANTSSKDQTHTRRAISAFRELSRRFPTSGYAEAARSMVRQSHQRLADHEFIVGRFYMKRKAFPAAVARFQIVLDEFPGYQKRDQVYFHLGQSLLKLDNDAEGRLYLGKLVTDYPGAKLSKNARKTLERLEGVRIDGPDANGKSD